MSPNVHPLETPFGKKVACAAPIGLLSDAPAYLPAARSARTWAFRMTGLAMLVVRRAVPSAEIHMVLVTHALIPQLAGNGGQDVKHPSWECSDRSSRGSRARCR